MAYSEGFQLLYLISYNDINTEDDGDSKVNDALEKIL